MEQIIFPGGDTSFVNNLEYRVPIAGPVTVAAFVDTGMDFISQSIATADCRAAGHDAANHRRSAARILTPTFTCAGGVHHSVLAELKPIPGTNYQPRMSTGLELQVIMPVVNAPFRFYYAYNPLRLDTTVNSPNPITRSMFPAGAAGDYTYANAVSHLISPVICCGSRARPSASPWPPRSKQQGGWRYSKSNHLWPSPP